MDIDAQLADAFSQQKQLPNGAVPAKITAIEGLMVDVETVEGLEVFDVRLCASEESKSFVKPTVGSWVIIAPLQGKYNYYIAAFSEVEETLTKTEKSTVRVNDNGLLLASQGENLQAVITDLIDEIAKIIVVQGTSPSVPALTKIKTRAKKILKDA